MKQVAAIAALLWLAANSAALADALPGCSSDATELKAIAATHSIPPYPPISMALGEKGRTTLKVIIGEDGVPTEVSTTTSSGSDRLDQAAESWVKQNWRWQAPQRHCKPTRAATLVSILWQTQSAPADAPGVNIVQMAPGDFPAGALDRHEHGTLALMLALDESGKVTGSRQVSGSGFADLDAQALTLLKARHWTAPMMDAKPVKSAIFVVVNWAPPAP